MKRFLAWLKLTTLFTALKVLQALLQRNLKLFLFVHKKIDNKAELRKISAFAAYQDPKGKAVLEELHQNGIACWRGMFSDTEFLARAKEYVVKLSEESKKRREDDPQKPYYIPEKSRGLTFVNCDEWMPEAEMFKWGRIRTRWELSGPREGNEAAADFANDPRVRQIVESYHAAPVPVGEVLIEEVRPSLESDHWHIDRFDEQTKVFLLVEDVTMKNGPLRYKIGSHRVNSPHLNLIKFLYFKNSKEFGHLYSNTNPPIAESVPGDIVYSTGKAGDVFFVDTRGLHSGTRALEGVRRMMVFYPHSPSFRYKAWDAIQLSPDFVSQMKNRARL